MQVNPINPDQDQKSHVSGVQAHPQAERLSNTIGIIFADGKFIHAADESGGNIAGKFKSLGIPDSPENRALYRHLMISTPGYANDVGGVILFDETVRQEALGQSIADTLKASGVVIGVKTDAGLEPFDGSATEQVGVDKLDLLPDRLKEYSGMGVGFTKHRVVAHVDAANGLPSDACLRANAVQLARYCNLNHDAGIVPIPEPEVIMENKAHDIDGCYKASARYLDATFTAMSEAGVYNPGVILKTNMVVPGTLCEKQVSDEEIAAATIELLKKHVPSDIGAVVFLSGGQEDSAFFRRLKLIVQLAKDEGFEYPVASSGSRALQGPSLKAFGGSITGTVEDQTAAVQAAFRRSLDNNAAAMHGLDLTVN